MAARFYKCPKTGNKLPSVTTITSMLDKPALVYWAANCACDYIINELEQFCVPSDSTKEENHLIELEMLFPIIESARKNFRKVSAKAMDIGSAVHVAIERYLKTGQEPEAPSDEVLSAFLAFLEWLDTWESYETVKTEHTVYADRYAGTTDWFVMLNGKKYTVDFKTYNEESKSQPPYNEAKYQVAGYRATDETIEGCGLLYLGKLTGKQLWIDTSDTYEEDLKIFNILTELWYAKEGTWKEKN